MSCFNDPDPIWIVELKITKNCFDLISYLLGFIPAGKAPTLAFCVFLDCLLFLLPLITKICKQDNKGTDDNENYDGYFQFEPNG